MNPGVLDVPWHLEGKFLQKKHLELTKVRAHPVTLAWPCL